MARSKTSSTRGITFLALLFVLAGFAAAQPPWAGSGDGNEPYQIWDANDLNALGADPNYYSAHFSLMADIDLSGYTYATAVIAPARTATYPFDGTAFTGVFDGNDYVIAKLTIDTGGTDHYFLGLFGQIASGATVRNLGIVNISISGGTSSNYIGGLVGWNDSATISQCYATGSVAGGDSSGRVGGLVGLIYHGQVTNCYSRGVASGSSDVGGLVGYNNSGTVDKSHSSGVFSGDSSVGGLVGGNQGGTITKCHSKGAVFGTSSAVGGLGGGNVDGYVSECYSTGPVSGSSAVGGLLGRNDSMMPGQGRVRQCYSTGGVFGSESLGGLIGYALGGSCSQCYWDQWTSGQTTSMGGTGKTTFEMKKQETYTGWDFVDTWYIVEDVIYPVHSWTPTPYKGDLNLDGHVDFYDFAKMANEWLVTIE